jgi:hypothetical protein
MSADGARGWRLVRGWLRMGPTRADLAAEAALWRARCDRSNAERDASRARAVQAGKDLRAAQRKIDTLLALAKEPDRVNGCSKVRFHRQQEAEDWAAAVASRTGEPVETYETYPCKACPRSPVTVERYWHVGHRPTDEARAAQVAGELRRRAEIIDARRGGRLLEQRVDPTVLARLRELGGGDGA